ncbi:gamma-glutamylcyclotransferase [Phycisphaeraceae bacterium D3-23]
MTDGHTSIYIFGYGSLIHPGSANTTLGRSATPALFPTATLTYYARCWSYATSMRRSGAAEDDPARGVALNIVPDIQAHCNGVLIEVTPEELARLDDRETYYDRVDVSYQTLPDDLDQAAEAITVYTYVGQREKRRLPPGAFISTRYDAVVREGAALYGEDFAQAFVQTTRPHTLPIREAVYPNDPVK